jgi:hypothetical protein
MLAGMGGVSYHVASAIEKLTGEQLVLFSGRDDGT